ncbi:MAG TPA: glycerol-3-phosphate dehydrogenase/oxidase [Candidatus Binatia bacterium]|nr:glycerol-3-phosphate dehydrogenase/oxidase [Candidatus Binatia bacterium]
MALAANPRASLDGQRFHVVVIGGGINGVAIARQCARSGKSVLLVEQNDFAAGVTSRSTRIIHGGLRYLEHGEIGLVRESLREREKLLRERSHLVHPMQFLLLLNENTNRSALKIRAGLWLYRRMAGKAKTAQSQSELRRFERALDSGHRWSCFSYEDAQCEFPERLVAEWLLEAVEGGAAVRNHTEAISIDIAHGRVRGVLLRDQLTGREQRVDAGWVINCTGPWADRVCQRSSLRMSKPMLSGVRGSHIILPRFTGSPSSAVYTEASDGRPIFVLPWNDQILVGTTEVVDDGDPEKTVPSPDETAYLVRSIAQLFPKAKITPQTVKHAFAGIRPLPYSPGSKPSAITRRHILYDHSEDGAGHMISVIGGKLTTAASLARECAHKLGLSVPKPGSGAIAGERALDPLLDDAVLEIARIGAVSEESARGMVEWHGKRAADIARMALVSAELRAPICPHTSHVIAEVVEAYRREYAVTLGDALLRRVPVALGACWSESCSREAARRIGAVMGWNDHTLGANLEGFENERTGFLRPMQKAAALEAAAD